MLQEQSSAEEERCLGESGEEGTCCSDMPCFIISIAKPRNGTFSSLFGLFSIDMLAVDVLTWPAVHRDIRKHD